VNQQGGKGSPRATFRQRLQDALFVARRALPLTHFLWTDPQISDKWFGADARLTFPGTGVDAYVEFGTTDDADLFIARPGKSLKHEAAWLGGLKWHGVGDDGRLDLWAEVAHNGVDAYLHGQFSSGLTLDRRVLGSPLGPLATAYRGGADWTGPAGRLSVVGAWERYFGDEYGFSREHAWEGWYMRIADNPDEIRVRATVDWRRESTRSRRLMSSVRTGYEHVTRFNFTDRARSNFLLQAGATWMW
jgi:hypothetical protein